MKVTVKAYHAVAAWKWDTSSESHKLFKFASPDNDGYEDEDDEDDDEVCGICRQAFEGCCPDCKVPGDDCPLSKPLETDGYVALSDHAVWGECSHVFHMHCLLKWIDTESSKQQCPLDRRPWGESDMCDPSASMLTWFSNSRSEARQASHDGRWKPDAHFEPRAA
jgi:anaphase-promoting complex subunit 11